MAGVGAAIVGLDMTSQAAPEGITNQNMSLHNTTGCHSSPSPPASGFFCEKK